MEVDGEARTADPSPVCGVLEGMADLLSAALRSRSSPGKSSLVEEALPLPPMLVELRAANRQQRLELEESKKRTAACRDEVNAATLRLHNFLYEKTHYRKEIFSCTQFRSRHEDLDLMPLEEYLQVEDPAVLDQCGDDEHLLMLARLRFELKSRQELCEEVRKLQEERRKLHEEVTRDTAFLGKLPDLLDSLFRAALPLQEYFAAPSSTTLDGVPVTESQVEGVEEDQLSLLLPKPLYTLYYQALNFQHTFGSIKVSIDGSEVDALRFNDAVAEREGLPSGLSAALQETSFRYVFGRETTPEREKEEGEEQEEEERSLSPVEEEEEADAPVESMDLDDIVAASSTAPGSRAQDSTEDEINWEEEEEVDLFKASGNIDAVADTGLSVEQLEKNTQDFLEKHLHPLSVLVSLLPGQDSSGGITLKFRFVDTLNKVFLSTAPVAKLGSLSCLYPGDVGLLSTALESEEELRCISGEILLRKLGGAASFNWCQQLCGFNVNAPMHPSAYEPISSASALASSKKTRVSLTQAIQKIRERVAATASLDTQIELLRDQKQIPDGYCNFSAPGLETTLRKFEKVEEAMLLAEVPGYRLKSLQGRWNYYRAVFSRNRLEVQALIEIGPEYPVRSPIFHLSFLHIPATLVPEAINFKRRADGGKEVLVQEELRSQVASDSKTRERLTSRPGLKELFAFVLKDMELEVMFFMDECMQGTPRDHLLMNQLKKLQICVEVFFDTHCRDSSSRGALFLNASKGRDRQMPLFFDKRFKIFTHAPAPSGH